MNGKYLRSRHAQGGYIFLYRATDRTLQHALKVKQQLDVRREVLENKRVERALFEDLERATHVEEAKRRAGLQRCSRTVPGPKTGYIIVRRL